MAAAVLSLLILLSMATLSLSFQFNVGGDKGWIKPPPANDPNAYNNWAGQTRFQIGDTLYFKYMNDDSVLVVNKAHYNACNANNAISKHTDGETVIKLDHDGLFYFISGNMENCRAGQKLIVDVLADHFGVDAPSPAPAPAPGMISSNNNVPPAGAPSDGGGSGRESSMPKSAADNKPYVSSAVLSFVAVVYMLL